MSVARTYAKALYEAARDAKASPEQLNQFENQLDGLIETIQASRDAQIALYGPVTTSKEKLGIVKQIAAKSGYDPLVTNFLSLLASKGRMSLLPEVREAFGAVRLQAEGGVLGSLVAAEPVNGSDLDGLAKAFSQKLGKRVAFRVETDPALLAGMKVTVNGVTYDGTLRSQLDRLRDRLTVDIASKI